MQKYRIGKWTAEKSFIIPVRLKAWRYWLSFLHVNYQTGVGMGSSETSESRWPAQVSKNKFPYTFLIFIWLRHTPASNMPVSRVSFLMCLKKCESANSCSFGGFFLVLFVSTGVVNLSVINKGESIPRGRGEGIKNNLVKRFWTHVPSDGNVS